MHDEISIFDAFQECSSAAVDSRKVTKDALFFALPGAKVDGHHYLQEAAIRGAKAAVVSDHYRGESFGLKLFHVSDTLRSLQDLAQQTQKNRSAKIIGITGSVGKTTTKEFIVQLLEKKFKVGYSPGNSNSQVGIPLTLLNHVSGDEDVLVLEMAMTSKGHITRLVEIAPPDVAVITSIELVHAGLFSSINDIAEAKGEILSHPHTKKAFLHNRLKTYSFASQNAQYYDLNSSLGGDHLPAHLKENLGAACSIARLMGLTEDEIFNISKDIKTVDRRFQISMKNGIKVINDGYNASAMLIALTNLPSAPEPQGKIIAVLGEILELGKFSQECHEKVGNEAVTKIDHLFLMGEGCRPIEEIFLKAGKRVKLYDDRDQLLQDLKNTLKKGDLLFLKGSRHWQLSELGDQL